MHINAECAPFSRTAATEYFPISFLTSIFGHGFGNWPQGCRRLNNEFLFFFFKIQTCYKLSFRRTNSVTVCTRIWPQTVPEHELFSLFGCLYDIRHNVDL